jgi:hypothetical protein
MGAGNPSLYDRRPDGTAYKVSKDWKRTVYRNNGKFYIVTGNAWTCFWRHRITEEQYNKAIDLMASWTENSSDYQSIPEFWRSRMTRLQKAYFNKYVGNNILERISN